jgi:hypothetical protein
MRSSPKTRVCRICFFPWADLLFVRVSSFPFLVNIIFQFNNKIISWDTLNTVSRRQDRIHSTSRTFRCAEMVEYNSFFCSQLTGNFIKGSSEISNL